MHCDFIKDDLPRNCLPTWMVFSIRSLKLNAGQLNIKKMEPKYVSPWVIIPRAYALQLAKLV